MKKRFHHLPLLMFSFAMLVVGLSVLNGVSWADKMAPYRTHTEFSKNQKFYIVLVPTALYRQEGFGMAFKVNDGGDKFLWSVDWYASRAYLSSDGTKLIRRGPWASNYKTLDDLAIAFYDKGRLLKKYSVADLIENKKSIERTASHYYWLGEDKDTPYGFSDDEKTFSLTTIEGRAFTFSTESGEVIKGSGKIDSLHLEADAKAVMVGETLQLRTIAHVGTGNVDQTKVCTYTSSDEKVARIIAPGVIMGIWSGKVSVTAELNGVHSNPLELEVLHAPPPMDSTQ